MSFTCLCICVSALLVLESWIFLENSFLVLLAERKEDTELFPLLAALIASRQNQLYIQDINEGDLNITSFWA